MNVYQFPIYGFLDDEFLYMSIKAGTPSAVDQGVGCFRPDMDEYFGQTYIINDVRTDRGVKDGLELGTKSVRLYIDKTQVKYPQCLDSIPNNELNELFSIIEHIVYSGTTSEEDLNEQLITLSTLNTYLQDSVHKATDYTTVSVLGTTGYVTRMIPNWIQFRVKWVRNDTIYDMGFKIYLSSSLFKTNYPYTIITQVVPPFDPEYFFNRFPENKSPIEYITSAIEYTYPIIDTELRSSDQTGILPIYVKYRIEPNRYVYVPFQVIYKGPNKPTNIFARKHIRNYLISLNLVDENTLKTVFPDLFIDRTFIIVPLWDLYTRRTNQIVYPCITPTLDKILDRLITLYGYTRDYHLSRVQLLTSAASTMPLVSVPHTLNTDSITLLDLYPTYTHFSTQSPYFEYMDMKDRNFAKALINGINILEGDILIDRNYRYYTEDGLEYLATSTDTTELYILTKQSYERKMSS